MLTNRSMPRSTVIPVLPYPDIGKAIDWLSSAFGFTLRLRIGDHRAQLNVGDGAVVLTYHPGFESRDSPHSIMVRVEDADSHYQRATLHGAQVLETPTDHPYGERQYTVTDLAGHRWKFSQTITDVAPEDWGGASGELN